jgi:hypothetical protein
MTDTVLLGLGTFNLPGTVQAVNSDLASVVSSLNSASSIISGIAGNSTCALSAADTAMVINNLGAAQSVVASIQTTLANAVATLSSGK